MESKKDVHAADLNILSISKKPGALRVRSKSNPDLRSNEFEIKTNTREERNDQVIENFICHICDINVPKVYFNKHLNSFRHKFNAKIADIASRRLELFMNKDEVIESYEEIPSKHYCSECSLVIDSDDEISHKQSIVHRNSIFLERFLNEFLKYYTNNENEINDTKEDSKISKRDLDSSEENKKLDSSSILDKALQFKNEVVFETVDGGRFKATKFNFHALMKINTLFEYCMICQRMFVIEKRSFHLNSDLHRENLLEKLPDKNCIRIVNKTQNHCILCNNYYFNNYEVHIHSEEHITNFENMMIPDECKKTGPLKNKTVNNFNIVPSTSLSLDVHEKLFCDSCNVWISIKQIRRHHTTKRHTLNKMSDYHYLLKFLDEDNLCCKICDVTVSNIFEDIIDHFTDVDHINKYDKLLQANNITKSDDTTYYCKECQVYILHKNEYLHIESKQHKNKISLIKTEDIDECTDKIKTKTVKLKRKRKLGNGNAIKTVEPGDAINVEQGNGNAMKTVEPGNAVTIEQGNGNAMKTVEPGDAVTVEQGNGNTITTVEPGNIVNVEQDNGCNVEPVSFREIIETAGQSENTVKPGSNPYFCNVCRVQVQNNVNNISEHNEGRLHMLKWRKQAITKVKKTSSLHYQMAETDTKNVVSCIVCDVDITVSDNNISTHIEGETHKNNYSEFCTRNLLVTLNNAMYCTVCGVYPGFRKEFSHCIGKKHTKSLV